jgi:dipeptidyl aminopeptidase/acylaminoacyl peptidase
LHPAEARQLFAARGRNGSPAWSPDARSLAFVSSRDDHSFIGVYRTGSRSLLYVDPTVDRDSAPRWSPDGGRIAFIRQPGRGGDPIEPSRERADPWSIMVADLKTPDAAKRVRESGPALDASLPRTAGDGILRWGADGRLVFVSEHDGWARLYSMMADGGEPVLLTPGEAEVEDYALAPDLKKSTVRVRIKVDEGKPSKINEVRFLVDGTLSDGLLAGLEKQILLRQGKTFRIEDYSQAKDTAEPALEKAKPALDKAGKAAGGLFDKAKGLFKKDADGDAGASS